MSADSPRHIGAAIDEAARRLTAIEPHGHMASRVVARLGAQRRRNWRATLVVAAAATATLVLAVPVVDRPVAPPRQTPGVTSAPLTSAAPAVAPSPEPVITAVPQPVATIARRPEPRITRPIEARPTPSESALEAAWRSRAVPALVAPELVQRQVSQPEPIDLPLLRLKPLELAPLQLAWLENGQRH